MRTIARFMDARNTAEGKFLSVLLSVLLVFSFLNVTMFTDYANATDETAPEVAVEENQSLDVVDPVTDEPEEEAEEGEGAPEQEQPESEEPAGEVNAVDTEVQVIAAESEVQTAMFSLGTNDVLLAAESNDVKIPLDNKNHKIKGTDGSDHKWSISRDSDTSIVKLSDDDEQTCKVKGQKSGNVTLIHKYWSKGA